MSIPIRVLIVEDSPGDAELMLGNLADHGFAPQAERVETEADYLAGLNAAPEVILADYRLPHFSGPRALELLNERRLDIPFIALSGVIGDEEAAGLIKLGASDFLLKDRMARLGPAVTQALKLKRARDEHRQMEVALVKSEQRFRTLSENSSDLMIVIDRRDMITYVSPSLKRIVGYEVSDALDRNFFDFIHPEDISAATTNLAAITQNRDTLRVVELRCRHKNGNWLTFETILRNALDEPIIGGIVVNARDITERKKQEQKIVRLSRIHAVMSGINSLIVRVRNRQELFNEACRVAAEHGGFGIAWIGMLDPDTLDVNPVAQAGLDSKLLTRNEITARGNAPEGQGVVGCAIREKRPEVINDFTFTPYAGGPATKEAIRRGYGSLAVFPLLIDDSAVGVLVLFAQEADFFTDDELKLLTELAGDISFALQAIARQEKLDKLSRIRAVSGEVNAAIIRIREQEPLLKDACRIAVEHGKFELVWTALIDQAKQQIQPVAWVGFSSEIAHDMIWANLGRPGGTLAEVIQTRKVAVRNDLDLEMPRGSLRQEAVKKGYRSTVCVPFMVDDSVVAASILFAAGRGFFDEEELVLLDEVAANVSFALQSIVRQKKVEKLSRTRAVSSGINSILIRVRNRQELFQQSCRVAVEEGQFAFSWIGVLDPATQDVTPVAWAGENAEELTKGKSSARDDSPRGKGAVGQAIRERRPILHNDITARNFGGPRLKEILRMGFQSQITLPLFEDQAVIGTLTMYAREPSFFDEEELNLLTELAGDISFALAYLAKEEKLSYLAYYDALTGLPNRALFDDRMAQHLRAASHEKNQTALVLIDVERFRVINDTLGRGTADELLKLVAARLQSVIFDRDSLARVHGDVFAALFPGIKDEADIARIVEEKMIACLSKPFTLAGQDVRVSAKAGVALFPGDATEADALFMCAEAALRQTKGSSDRYLFYARQMNARVAERLKLENKLQGALARDEFVLFYQPKVDLSTGRVTGLEALMRWNDPGAGLVPPMLFIPLLEATGMIIEVGAWAMKRAVSQYAAWQAAGLHAPRIAVNVSQVQLKRKDFVAMVQQAIAVAGKPDHGLDLEITESMIMEDIESSIEKLKLVRDLGVGIAIDDFGTGHSSLRYLTRLPITALKIDLAFVRDMTTNPENMAIVSTIITLARTMNLKVIAEGVETEEQSKYLRLLRCDEMQGYLFSKPVPAEQVPALLARGGEKR